MVNLNIPVGVSDFEKIRENNYYYIDKTGFIARLLQMKSAEVTLITRPRRFGKHWACACSQVFLIYEKTVEAYLKVWKLPGILLCAKNG